MSNVENVSAQGGKTQEKFAESTMYVLAILLAIVSGYTTLNGMLAIFGTDEPVMSSPDAFFATSAAFIITAVVQAALTVMCWVLGKDLAAALTARMHDMSVSRSSAGALAARYVMMALLVTICLIISVFFSFNTYFNSLYREDTERDIAQASVPDFAIEVRTLLSQAVSEFRTEQRALIIESADGYITSSEALLALAESNSELMESRIEELNKQRQEVERERIRREIEASARASQVARTTEQKRERITEIDTEISALTEQIGTQRERIAALKAEEREFREEAQAQLDGLGDRVAGRGPAYQNAVRDADQRDREAKAVENQVIANESAIESLEDEQVRLRVEVAQNTSEAEGVQNNQGAEQSGSEEPPVEVPENIAETLVAFTNALNRFKDLPTEARFQTVNRFCSDISKAVSEEEALRENLSGNECRIPSEQTRLMLVEFSRQNDLINGFTAKCGSLEVDGLQIESVIGEMRSCQTDALKTGVPREAEPVKQASEAIAAFQLRFDPDQHEFLKTLQAFLISPMLAALALFIAMVQDVAVFIMTFIVEFFRRESRYVKQEELGRFLDGTQRSAIRSILIMSSPAANDTGSWNFNFDAGVREKMSDDEIIEINNILAELRDRNLIRTVSETEHVISADGRRALDERLKTARQYENDVAPAPVEAPEEVSPPEPEVQEQEDDIDLRGLSAFEAAAVLAKRKRRKQAENPSTGVERSQRKSKTRADTKPANRRSFFSSNDGEKAAKPEPAKAEATAPQPKPEKPTEGKQAAQPAVDNSDAATDDQGETILVNRKGGEKRQKLLDLVNKINSD